MTFSHNLPNSKKKKMKLSLRKDLKFKIARLKALLKLIKRLLKKLQKKLLKKFNNSHNLKTNILVSNAILLDLKDQEEESNANNAMDLVSSVKIMNQLKCMMCSYKKDWWNLD